MQRSIKIGRNENNTIRINNNRISREHAEIVRVKENTYLIKDLGSAHGVFVNGNKIKQTQIDGNSTVLLGNFELDIRFLLNKLDSDTYTKKINYDDLQKQIEINKQFLRLEQIYEQYKKDKQKLRRGSGLKKTGVRAGLALIPFVGNAIGIMAGGSMDSSKEMDDLNEQFKKDYVCPKCFHFLGFEPFENHQKRGYCFYCKSEWNK